MELTIIFAREMLELVGINGKDPERALKDGSAMDVWRKMISAQGGNPDAPLPVAKEKLTISADASGTVLSMDAMSVGVAAWRLGAGRSRQGESVQSGAGIEIHKKPGEKIVAGEPLYTLHTDTPERFARAQEVLEGSVAIGSTDVKRLPLIVERIN